MRECILIMLLLLLIKRPVIVIGHDTKNKTVEDRRYPYHSVFVLSMRHTNIQTLASARDWRFIHLQWAS